MIQRRVLISGKVQGVGFRAAMFAETTRFSGLKGYVKNLNKGQVEAVFAGDELSVLRMVAWCRIGPPASTVDQVEVFEEKSEPALDLFQIVP